MAINIDTMETTPTTYVSVTETAKLVRENLKAAFPGVRFSVRSSKYAGGASLAVRWTDGPTAAEVDVIAGLYAGARFDSMQDMKVGHESMLARPDGSLELVRYLADYVNTYRTVSDDHVAHVGCLVEAGQLDTVEVATGDFCDAYCTSETAYRVDNGRGPVRHFCAEHVAKAVAKGVAA